MTIKIKEENGDEIEFSTVAEMLEYKKWKAEERQTKDKVVILHEKKEPIKGLTKQIERFMAEPIATPQSAMIPSHSANWIPRRKKRQSAKLEYYTEHELQAVKDAFMRNNGKFKYGGISSIARTLGVNAKRICNLVQNYRERWSQEMKQKPIASPTRFSSVKEYFATQVREYIAKQNPKKKLRDVVKIAAKNFSVPVSRVYHIFRQMQKDGTAPAIGRTSITKQQIQKVKDLYLNANKTPTGKLHKGQIKEIAKESGITLSRAYSIVNKLKTADIVPMPRFKTTDRKKFIWGRIKSLESTYPNMSVEKRMSIAAAEWNRYGKLGKSHPENEKSTSQKHENSQKQKALDKSLEFPGIYPLADHSVRIFEQMIVDLIARKHSKIDYYIASQNLQLVVGKEWGFHTWREFCMQFSLSIPRIAEALVGCDAKKLKLEKVDRSWVICYG